MRYTKTANAITKVTAQERRFRRRWVRLVRCCGRARQRGCEPVRSLDVALSDVALRRSQKSGASIPTVTQSDITTPIQYAHCVLSSSKIIRRSPRARWLMAEQKVGLWRSSRRANDASPSLIELPLWPKTVRQKPGQSKSELSYVYQSLLSS